ncbi:MAG: hypothetical protein ABW252_10815 [Polyangiales bacterium]
MSVSPLLAAIGLVGSWFVAEAHAEPPPAGGGEHAGHGGPPREPPPFAFTACEDKSAGDTCTVQLRDHELTGSCESTSDDRLFCRPEHMPPPPDKLPPDGPRV